MGMCHLTTRPLTTTDKVRVRYTLIYDFMVTMYEKYFFLFGVYFKLFYKASKNGL